MVKAALPTPVHVGHNRVRSTRGAGCRDDFATREWLRRRDEDREVNGSRPDPSAPDAGVDLVEQVA
jgi:hypothetical protein